MSSVASANAASYFVDRHVEEGRSGKVAFREYGSGRSLTYGDLADTSGRVATALAQHGIVPEQRVAMLVLDTIEFPQIFWGALKAGVIPVPLNTLLATSVYDAILRDSRATTLFVCPRDDLLLGPHGCCPKDPPLGGWAACRTAFADQAWCAPKGAPGPNHCSAPETK